MFTYTKFSLVAHNSSKNILICYFFVKKNKQTFFIINLENSIEVDIFNFTNTFTVTFAQLLILGK